MSLKTILRNFLNHYETLEERRKCPDGEEDLYAKEFQSLKELTESLKRDNFYSCKHGLKDVNRRKNRYKDILPYDYSRVILSEYPGVPGSDYINANFVRGSTGSACAYVASQGPLPNTVVDFWRMIWECEVSVIVMACNETESGKYKCETYWPIVTDQEQQYGNITAQLIKWRQVCPDFLVRTFRVKSDNEERIVCQFHYTTWPDHGVPSTVGPILELVRLMRDVQASEARPILVHCSAGCGRTGTICSIDYVWALLRTGKLKEDFSLYKIIHEMRRQRIAMVQTQEQYILCYRAVAALFEQQLKMIDAHTYENLDEDGEPYHKFTEEENTMENSSSDEGSWPGFTEPEIHYKAQRSATFPSKDMKQLIDSWKSKKMTAAPSNEYHPHPQETVVFNDTYGSHDNKQHEKLIGKATVIRRPSIAKFKAMFGSMELAQLHHQQQHNYHPHLQPEDNTRSEISNETYYHNNFSNRFQDSDCTDSVAASDQEGDTDRESSRFPVNSNHQCDQKSFPFMGPDLQNCAPSIITTDSNHEPDSGDEVDGERTYASHVIRTRPRENDPTVNKNKSPHRTSRLREELPPPKPPRTYQYGTKGNTISSMNARALQGQLNSDNGGRIIVSVAQRVRPRILIPEGDRSTRPESKSHTDLYASSTYSNIPAFSYNPLPSTNQYYNFTPEDRQPKDNMNQDRRNQQPLYECLKNDRVQPTGSRQPLIHNIYRPPLSRMPVPPHNKLIRPPAYIGPKMSEPNRFAGMAPRRELTSPAILMQNSRIPNGSMPPRDHAMFSINNRPMLNIPNRPRPPVQLPPDSRKTHPNKTSMAPQTAMKSNQAKPTKQPSTTPTSAPQATAKTDEKTLMEAAISNPNEKKKLTKTNSKTSCKNSTKSGKDMSQQNSEKKHHPFSFSSTFFPFRKATKPKGTTSLNQQLGSYSNSPGNPSIRPPHSHRFSPPTQWTQV